MFYYFFQVEHNDLVSDENIRKEKCNLRFLRDILFVIFIKRLLVNKRMQE